MADLPSLASFHPVTDTHVEQLRTRGHTLLRSVLSPGEVAAYFPVARQFLLHWRDTNDKPVSNDGNIYSPDLWTVAGASSAVTDLVTAPRLGEIAARLLEVDAVRILYFKFFLKPAGGAGTSVHQDFNYFPLATDRGIMLWIPLMDVTPEQGGLIYAEGSHRHGPLKPRDARRFPVVKNGAMRAGDVSAHSAWIIHGALKNSTDSMREAISVCYYADGACISALTGRVRNEAVMTRIFPGLVPGDMAASEATPVVFRRNPV